MHSDCYLQTAIEWLSCKNLPSSTGVQRNKRQPRCAIHPYCHLEVQDVKFSYAPKTKVYNRFKLWFQLTWKQNSTVIPASHLPSEISAKDTNSAINSNCFKWLVLGDCYVLIPTPCQLPSNDTNLNRRELFISCHVLSNGRFILKPTI